MPIIRVCYYHVLWGDRNGRGLDVLGSNKPHIIWGLCPTLWPAQNPSLQASLYQSESHSGLIQAPGAFLLGFRGWEGVTLWSLFSVSLYLLPHGPLWAYDSSSLG